MEKLLIATNNQGKVREIEKILGDRYDMVTPKELGLELEVIEDGETFEENARKKARAFMQATGLDALADDSGLCGDALDGAPGVYSARYGGEGTTDIKNNQKLLDALQNVPEEKRTAQFVCCAALCKKDGSMIVERGESHGVILYAPRGENGFGYDPLFYNTEYKKTYAELDGETKNLITNRAKAMKKIMDRL